MGKNPFGQQQGNQTMVALQRILLLNDLQKLHGACLNANAAGDTLAGRTFSGGNHNLHGAYLCALAAGGAKLLVDHVHTGLGVLRNSTGLANLHALATLDASHGLSLVSFRYNTDAGKIFIKLFVESRGTCANAFQAGHTLNILLYGKSLH